MILCRVWLNRLWFGIHNKMLNFHEWTLRYNELFHDNRRKWKSMDLSMDLWHSNNMKVILPNFVKDHWIIILEFPKTWLNLHLCGRNPIKSVLFVWPSACLYVCDTFSSGSTLWIFKIFLHENILPYILKSDQVIICLLSR